MDMIKLIVFIFLFSYSFFGSTKDTAKDKMIELSNELRCMVCQNQSLLESDSELAKDLKKLIEDKFSEGETKEQIKIFLVERYGEFILFNPPLSSKNLLLWLSPLISILIMSVIAFRKFIFFKK